MKQHLQSLTAKSQNLPWGKDPNPQFTTVDQIFVDQIVTLEQLFNHIGSVLKLANLLCTNC